MYFEWKKIQPATAAEQIAFKIKDYFFSSRPVSLLKCCVLMKISSEICLQLFKLLSIKKREILK
jgi:hypothetical protein